MDDSLAATGTQQVRNRDRGDDQNDCDDNQQLNERNPFLCRAYSLGSLTEQGLQPFATGQALGPLPG